MPEGFRIASAYVTVEADTDPADRDVSAFLGRLDAATKDRTVRVDVTGDAVTQAAKVQAAVNAIKGVQIPLAFDLSPASVTTAIGDARAAFAAAGGITVPVRFDVSPGSVAALTAAGGAASGFASQLADLTAKADGTTLALVALDVELDRKRTALAGTALDAGALGAVMATLATVTKDTAAAANTGARGWTIWGVNAATAIHWIVSGGAEIAAVVIPAMVAAGSWAAVWAQGAQNVYQHMTSVYTATEATANIFHTTAGQAIGLGDALQKAQDQANPQVYQALGAAVTIVKDHFGALAQTGLQVGGIFDTFTAKLVYDMSSAGGAGNDLNNILAHMVPDLTQLGAVLGNLGRAILSIASQMPGLAEVLLGTLATVTHLISDIVQFTGKFSVAGITILTAAMAVEEFMRWGGLLVPLLDRMGLATADMGTRFLSLTRLQGVFLNLFRAAPLLLANTISSVGSYTMAVAGTESAVGGAGLAMRNFGADITDAVTGMGFWESAGIAVAAVGLGILIDKLVTARTAAQAFADSLQQAAQKASDLDLLTVTAGNISQLNDKVSQTTASMHQMAQQGADTSGAMASVGKYATAAQQSQAALTDSYGEATSSLAAYRAGLVQQRTDQANVLQGGIYLANYYHTSLTGALALAQEAGVNLTRQITGQGEAAFILRQKIADLVQGYTSMGQPITAVGNDITALAIQSGLATTKASQLEQAWTQFMGNLTAGTTTLASFEQDLTNLTAGTTNIGNILGKQAGSITLTVKQFAQAMTSFTGQGAQAWQNFGNVVGQTAPQLINWFTTAGAEGAMGAQAFARSVGDIVAQLLPFAKDSKTAQAEVAGLIQMGGGPFISTFQGMVKWVDSTGASATNLSGDVKDLGANVGATTRKMADMSQIAQNLGTVLQTQLTNMMDQARLSTSHVQEAITAYTQDLQDNTQATTGGLEARQQLYNDLMEIFHNTQTANQWIQALTRSVQGNTQTTSDGAPSRAQLNTDITNVFKSSQGAFAELMKYDGEIRTNTQNTAQGHQTRQTLISDIVTAGIKAGDSKTAIAEMIAEILKIPAKAAMQIVIDATGHVSVTGGGILPTPTGKPTSGQPPPGLAGGGAVFGPGGPTSDVIPAMLSAGEYVVPAAAVDYYGMGFMEAVRAQAYADGGPVIAGNPGILSGVAEVSAYNTTLTDDKNATVARLQAAIKAAQQAWLSSGGGYTGGQYNDAQVRGFWEQMGGPGGVIAQIASAITGAESGRSNVVQKGQPYATTGWGLWQITPGDSEPQFGSDQQLLNPLANAGAAVAKYRGAGGFSPWTTYMDGAYQRFMGPASYGGQSGIGTSTKPGPGGGYASGGPVRRLASGGHVSPGAPMIPALSTEQKTGLAVALAYLNGKVTTIATEISEERKLIADIHKYYSGDAAASKIALIKRQTAELENLTRQEGAVAAKITAAKSYESQVQQGLSGYADLSNLTAGSLYTGVGKTVTGPQALSFQLKQKLTSLRAFGAALKKLSAAHLDATLIEQIVALGPDAGLQWAQEILADPALIKTLNGEEAQISVSAAEVARGAASSVYEGKYVSGPNWLGSLKKQQAGLEKVMEHLGDVLGEEAAKWFHVPGSKLPAVAHPKPKPKPRVYPGYPEIPGHPVVYPGAPEIPAHRKKAAKAAVHVEGGLHITVPPGHTPHETARQVRNELALMLTVAP